MEQNNNLSHETPAHAAVNKRTNKRTIGCNCPPRVSTPKISNNGD